MVMYQYNNGAKFNMLGSVKYNSAVLRSIKQVYTRIGPRPIILDQNKNALAVLENAYDIILEQEVNGIDELTFSLPFTDEKREFLANENLVQMFDTIYVIREVSNKKTGEPSVEVFCEALWYDLQYADPLEKTEWTDATPYEFLTDILQGTGWRVGDVEITSRRNVKLDEESQNRLQGIWAGQGVYGGDVVFDTDLLLVHLKQPNTKHSGAAIVYKKNMQEIEAHYDTKDLITRLYLYGKNGLSIADANNGVPYIENYSFANKKRVRILKDERFTNPFHLKEYGEQLLETLSKPRVSYRMTIQVLSQLSGLSHEQFTIGDIIRVYDSELGIDENTRIMKWSYNVAEPWNTKVELESKTKGISDLLTGYIGSEGQFASEDAVERQEMLELMVFNYLLNSRADDGFAYWTNNGWEIDALNGYSGPASFKAVGALGQMKSIKQTVYPSHREAYSLSFRAAVNNLVKGPNGKVGVNVKITYDDGSTEEKFIPLA